MEQKENQLVQAPRKKREYSKKRRLELDREYERIDERRTQEDFMYMMLSPNNPEEYRNQMRYLGDIIAKTYGHKVMQHGLNKEELELIQWIVDSNNPLYQDALWFISLDLLPSLRNWMLVGNPETHQMPPRLGDVEMFNYFCKNTLRTLREDLLDGRLDRTSEEFDGLETFVVACRSEYMSQVGFCYTIEKKPKQQQ